MQKQIEDAGKVDKFYKEGYNTRRILEVRTKPILCVWINCEENGEKM